MSYPASLYPSDLLYPGESLFPLVGGIYHIGSFISDTLYPSETLYPSYDYATVVPPQPIIYASGEFYPLWQSQQPSYQSYLDYLRTNMRHSYFKIELLRQEDESAYLSMTDDIINADGSVTNQLQEGVRRTCSFSINNITNKYTKFFNNTSIGTKFRLWLGYKIRNKVKWFQHGVFVFDNPSIVSQLSDNRIQITATDKWSLLNGQNGGILDATFIAPMGSNAADVVRTILNLPIVSDPKPPLIDGVEGNLTYDITKQAGETVADLLLEIAFNLSCYVYYDETGRLVMRPFEYDYIKSPVFHLQEDDYNYLGLNKELSYDKIYNAVQVRADNLQNENAPIIVEVINNDLTDPNSYPNYGIKKMFLVTDYIKGISTEALALARANWELKNVTAKQSNISATTLSLYHLDVNNIIELTDVATGDNRTRYLINGITTPISTSGNATIQLIRTSDYM